MRFRLARLWLLPLLFFTLSRSQAPAAASSGEPMPGALRMRLPKSHLERVDALAKVAILHEGRVKPLETFARHVLLQLSGRSAYQGHGALSMLGRMLFAPELLVREKLFLINDPEVAEAMGIAPEKGRRYAFVELMRGLGKLQELANQASAVEDEKRTVVDKEALRVYENVLFYLNLTQSLGYALPQPVFEIPDTAVRARLGLPAGADLSFWDLMARARAISAVLEGVGNRPDTLRTPLERAVIRLSQDMYFQSQDMRPSPLKALPDTAWLSPGEAVGDPAALQRFRDQLDAWARAARAYRDGDQKAFDAAAAALPGLQREQGGAALAGTHFGLELLYQRGEPFYYALILDWAALLGCFLFFLFRKRPLYLASLGMALAAYALVLAGLVARVIIMRRPPVTGLYETFPFVLAVAGLVAFFLERVRRRGVGLLAVSLLGVILLSIAGRYAAEGDTLRVLVAVLNSNFWLSTHVVCITIGYSACVLAGALGHVWLVRAVWPKEEGRAQALAEIQKMVYGVVCFGLLFSFIGTVLGGIWADQSWGRFWGWDPKENGALLIVIWCLILLHARLWGVIRGLGLALGSVFGAVVVAWAWFGVNLLGVGLHSYGFTSGAATKLAGYVAGELAFMLVTGLGVKLGWGRGRTSPPARTGAPAGTA